MEKKNDRQITIFEEPFLKPEAFKVVDDVYDSMRYGMRAARSAALGGVRDTSRVAYVTKARPTMGEKKQRILIHLRMVKNATNLEISKATGININAVCSSMNSLRKDGKVLEWGKRSCSITGNIVYAWEAAQP